MKKALLLGMLSVAGAGAYAATTPEILPQFYARYVSIDGKWLTGELPDGSTLLYDRTTSPEEAGVFEDVYLGNGNMIALDGTCVGSTYLDESVIFKGTEMIYVDALFDYDFSTLNGITPDGSRVCGAVSDVERKSMYVPMYMDRDENGEYTEVNVLPHPDKDFTGSNPQYCSATWISEDGRTILGQVVDASGMYIYPIVYRQAASGEWTYSLPSESLWNPNNIVIPEDPGEFEMKVPDVKDFMTAENREKYEADYLAWQQSGYQDDLYPDNHIENYMSAEEYAAYDAYYNEYKDAADIYNAKFSAFLEARAQVYDESSPFIQNACAMNLKGTKFVSTAAKYERDPLSYFPKEIYTNYIFDIEAGTFETIDSKYDNVMGHQILANGDILACTPANVYMTGLPTVSYAYKQGGDDFIPFEEYLAESNPDAAAWITEDLTADILTGYDDETYEEIYTRMVVSGIVSASDDFTTVAGGVFAFMLPDPEIQEMTYMTYLFTDLEGSGVKAISADNYLVKASRGGILSINGSVSDLGIFDISGRQLFKASKAQGIVNTNVKNGIYVLSYEDKEGNRVSTKIVF